MKIGPFRKLIVLGESTVQGGGWLASDDERYADIPTENIITLIETLRGQA